MISNDQTLSGHDSNSSPITPSQLRDFIDQHQKQINTRLIEGGEAEADIHRLRVGLALWSLAFNNSDHEHFQLFYDKAYAWTRDELLEIDVGQILEQTGSPQGATEQSASGQSSRRNDKHDHTASEDDDSPAEQAASKVLDRIREPERTLDELRGPQLRRDLNSVIRDITLSLELSDHPAYDHRNLGNVLFTGPPGTGKTTAAEGLANALATGEDEFNFLPIKGHHFKNHLLGASEGAVEEIFHRADEIGPTLVFIDEFEEVATRGEDRHEVTQAITNTLLSLLSGGQAVDNVALVGATNRPEKVDPAIRSRFEDNIVEFTEPPSDVKHEILLDALRGPGVTVECPPQALKQLSYEGLVGRELETAARDAIRRASTRRETKPYRVTGKDIQQAVVQLRDQQDKSLAGQ